jgi:hypothetical protein
MKGRGQNISSAVMAQRVEAPDSLDFFPTPPWATRALCEHLNHWGDISTETCLEPACGEGHMARPLAEYFAAVAASDIHDYGFGQVADFLGHDGLFSDATPQTDWIVTNPPFNKAAEFARRGIALGVTGVALLVRTSFLEGGERWRDLFDPHPPEWILQFCERVPMLKGRLDRRASSATSYCWLIWLPLPAGASEDARAAYRSRQGHPAFVWLPPGTRARLERDSDYQPVTTD